MVLASGAKAKYESPKTQAFCDIPLFAAVENTHVQQNKVDTKFIIHKGKVVHAVQMTCPWIDNRSRKEEEKTLKHGPLKWELNQQFSGYNIKQYNIIINVLGGWFHDATMHESYSGQDGERFSTGWRGQ